MTKGEKLIWGLFEMVREIMPATAANTERFNAWAAAFREMEHPAAAAAAHEELDEPAEDEPDEPSDPHEHGVPTAKRKKK